MDAADLVCERCRGVVVPAYTPFNYAEIIKKRSKKGRMLYYCSDVCYQKHNRTVRL